MQTKDFEKIVHKHSLSPGDKLYNSNALAGEAGEAANQVKKICMAIRQPEWVTSNNNSLPTVDVFREQLKEELSDVLFYLTRLALDSSITLDELMWMQTKKLCDQTDKYQRTFLK